MDTSEERSLAPFLPFRKSMPEIEHPHYPILPAADKERRTIETQITQGLVAHGSPQENAAEMAATLQQWGTEILLIPQALEKTDDKAWNSMDTYAKNGVPAEGIDLLRQQMVYILSAADRMERTVRWLQSMNNPEFMTTTLFTLLRKKQVGVGAIKDHYLTRAVLEGVRDQGPAERWGKVLRMMRFNQMEEGYITETSDGVIKEDQELKALGLLRGDAVQDWRLHCQEQCPSAPWRSLEALVKKDALWNDLRLSYRQGVATIAGASIDTIFTHEIGRSRTALEDVRRTISLWEQKAPAPAYDELRFLFALTLYHLDHKAYGQHFALDITTPHIMIDLVEALIDWEQEDEAWKLTRGFKNAETITDILLCGTWSDAANKRKKLQEILEPIDKRNMNRFPPWLRVGCLEAMEQIHQEEGDVDTSKRMRRSINLIQKQLASGYFKYRGNGQWR